MCPHLSVFMTDCTVSPAQVASEHAAADSCSPTARSHLGCGVFLIDARKTFHYDYDLILEMEPETCRARSGTRSLVLLKDRVARCTSENLPPPL